MLLQTEDDQAGILLFSRIPDRFIMNIMNANIGLLDLTWTTWTTRQREKGRVTMMITTEKMVSRCAQIPGPSSQT